MRPLKAMNRQEGGQILIIVLAILAFASLAVVPVLKFMDTGLVTTSGQGEHTRELYAAEAGVRDAFWKIQNVVSGLPKQQSDPPLQYCIAGNLNGESVNVTISRVDSETYRVHSVATQPITNHQTTIDSDLAVASGGGVDLSGFATYALTSPGTITTKSSDTITGNVWVQVPITGDASINGTITLAPVTGWPTASQLETYFASQVNESSPYSNGTIDVSQPGQSGPLYAQGYPNGNYTITGTGNLTGTIYVVGNLSIDNNAHINLNGQTIFVTGNLSTSPQSSLAGPGALIALGDITFSPQVSPSFIFVMSVSGQVNFQPQGDFVGAVCGDTSITLQPNCTLTWQSPGVGQLGIPGLYNTLSTSAIKTWTIH